MPGISGLAPASLQSYIENGFVQLPPWRTWKASDDAGSVAVLNTENQMLRFVQALEPRRLLSGTPSDPAVAAAVTKVMADVVQMHTDATNFHASIAATNAAFLTAKAADLTAIHADIASGNQQQLALDRQKFKSDVTAHTAGLKADVASFKTTHRTDLTTLHTDMIALQQARKAAH